MSVRVRKRDNLIGDGYANMRVCEHCGGPKCRKGTSTITCRRAQTQDDVERDWVWVKSAGDAGGVIRRAKAERSQVRSNGKLRFSKKQMAQRDCEEWAEILGVDPAVFRRYYYWVDRKGWLCWVECDAYGRPTAIVRRSRKGQKRVDKGGHRGLLVPRVRPFNIQLLIAAEGASDALVAASMYLDRPIVVVIGRPSKSATAEVNAFIRHHRPDEIDVVLDPDDTGPTGGLAVAACGAACGAVTRAFTPGEKDLRDMACGWDDPRAEYERIRNATEPLKPAGKFAPLSHDDVMGFPPLRWIVTDILPELAIIAVYGPPKTYKSVFAMWLAVQASQHGSIVYVYGEGRGGLRSRVAVLQKYKGHDPDRIRWVTQPVNLLSEDEVGEFIAAIAHLQPKVVVIDTLARGLLGGDENSAQDMGRAINSLDRIRDELGCSLVVVHHTGKDRSRNERGSSALRGALDAMLAASAEDGKLTIAVDAARDFEPPEPLRFVAVGTEAEGESAVMLKSTTLNKADTAKIKEQMGYGGKVRKTLQSADAGLTYDEILQAIGGSRRTLERHVGELIAAGCATKSSEKRDRKEVFEWVA